MRILFLPPWEGVAHTRGESKVPPWEGMAQTRGESKVPPWEGVAQTRGESKVPPWERVAQTRVQYFSVPGSGGHGGGEDRRVVDVQDAPNLRGDLGPRHDHPHRLEHGSQDDSRLLRSCCVYVFTSASSFAHRILDRALFLVKLRLRSTLAFPQPQPNGADEHEHGGGARAPRRSVAA